MNLIIAGSRNFNDARLLNEVCDHMFQNLDQVEIVSGGARGADRLGEQYAIEHGYPVKQFLPDWKSFGRGAGLRRNNEMADYADGLLAFWDGTGRGTKQMIQSARERGLKVKVFKI